MVAKMPSDEAARAGHDCLHRWGQATGSARLAATVLPLLLVLVGCGHQSFPLASRLNATTTSTGPRQTTLEPTTTAATASTVPTVPAATATTTTTAGVATTATTTTAPSNPQLARVGTAGQAIVVTASGYGV